MESTRRGFLSLMAGTMVAPFVPDFRQVQGPVRLSDKCKRLALASDAFNGPLKDLLKWKMMLQNMNGTWVYAPRVKEIFRDDDQIILKCEKEIREPVAYKAMSVKAPDGTIFTIRQMGFPVNAISGDTLKLSYTLYLGFEK